MPGVGAMLAASDISRARTWYEEKLSFVPYREYDDELLVYRSGRSRFSVYRTPSAGTAKNTVAVWRVQDLVAEVADLRSRGVVFEDDDVGDERTVDGILADAEGDTNAWFKDSEGNILALAQIRAGTISDANEIRTRRALRVVSAYDGRVLARIDRRD